MTDDDPKKIWQNQSYEGNPISLDEIRREVRNYRKRTLLVNVIDYLAALLVLAYFAWGFYRERNTGLLINAGFGLLIVGTLYMLYQRRKKGSARPLPAEMGYASYIESYRNALVRRREVVRSIWQWGIAPFIPGLALLEAAAAYLNFAHRTPLNLALTMLGYNAVIVVGFFLVWKFNQWKAQRLQKNIEELDALSK